MQEFHARVRLALFLALFAAPICAQITIVEEGGEFAEGNLARRVGAKPIALDALAGFEAIHNIPHLTDGVYGNANSWIGETSLFAGVALGEAVQVASIAFGRDNTGQFADRSTGTYIFQFTTQNAADETTPDEDWQLIGEITIPDDQACPPAPALRHRYNFDPVEATAIRIIVPATGLGGGTAIDEIEVYSDPGDDQSPCEPDDVDECEQPDPELPEWEGELKLVEEGGCFAADNLALNPGAVPFATDSLEGFDIHNIINVNDGVYGNSNSWIGQTGLFAGVYLGNTFTVTSIALGRDNLGTFMDRSLGTYAIQFTQDDPVDEFTPEDEWETIGEFTFGGGDPCPGSPSLRHRFNFEPVEATAIRIIVPATGLGGGTCIDEIEIYGTPGEDKGPCDSLCDLINNELAVLELGGPTEGDVTPDAVLGFDDGNLARAPDAIAFGTPPPPAPVHEIAHLNDGVYGNSNSWLGNENGATSEETYAGIYFEDGPRFIDQVALGRDNLGQFPDRAVGCYAIQVTLDEFDWTDDAAVAAALWQSIGKGVDHLAGDQPQLRRRYQLPDEVDVRALRVVTTVQNAIDEIELFHKLGAPGEGDLLDDPVEAGGCMDEEKNLSLRPEATSFALDSLEGFANIHNVPFVRDGIYGNTNSWIGNSGNPGFIGINLGDRLTVSSIAFGRDNGGEPNEFMDRNQGLYIIQYSTEADASELTPNDAWTTIGQVNYDGLFPPDGTPHLRHRYNFDSVEANAIRIIVPGTGLGGGTCIDEIELYEEDGDLVDDFQGPCIMIPSCGFAGVVELDPVSSGGPVDTPAFPEEVPSSDVGNLARLGTATAFGSPPHPAAVHEIIHLNDGFYGNSNSWLGNEVGADSGLVYAGIYFDGGPLPEGYEA